MSLRFENWFKAIETRRSRRTYISKQIESKTVDSLKEVINKLNELHQGVRLAFVEKSPDPVFAGAVGPYGKITGAPAYLAIVINDNGNFNYEKAGFIGEAIILEATMHGLSTCWIGGYFNNDVSGKYVGLKENEKVVAVIPIGHARKNLSLTEKMLHQAKDYHKRKVIEEIVGGIPKEQWPRWITNVIKAASLSPSAYNRQSIRFIIGEDDSIILEITNPDDETNVPKGIDRGIAMLHIEVAVDHYQIPGQWRFDDENNLVIFQKTGI